MSLEFKHDINKPKLQIRLTCRNVKLDKLKLLKLTLISGMGQTKII